ncbi:MAG: class I SAM-dependent methyltransferase [Saccharofermentans sp.]|nr:class I SAM-dependent methyltransferase [Saccharofermentans sp.]
MFVADKWNDFEVLYAGDGMKSERWGDVYLMRPDPQAIWPMDDNKERMHAVYKRSSTGGGSWDRLRPMPNSWKISYDSLGKKLQFIIEPTSFKHTGLFPEQAANWDWFGNIIENAVKEGRDDIKILNLFAYTGGATCASACHGAAETVHVDASKGMIQRAKENIVSSELSDKYVRFIAEDCRRFVEREIRRGRKYDGIIMDPPKYGRGPTGELWEIEKSLYEFVDRCSLLLSDDPLFFLISSYATELGPSCAGNVLRKVVASRFGGNVSCDELGLPISKMGFDLPCGQSARWSKS